MTEQTRTAILTITPISIVVALLGYLGYLYPPYVNEKAPSEAVSGQRVEKAVDIGQNPVQATFDDLLDAIEWVESKGDPNAVGDGGAAIGAYQIHKIYVDDVNRIMHLREPVAMALTGDIFSYKDRWDKEKSRGMAFILTLHYAEKAWSEIWKDKQFKTSSEKEGFTKFYELMARIHNAGPDGWRNDPDWFVRNRNYTLERAEKKITNAKIYWSKVKQSLEAEKVK